jgi:hypothetical protein
MKRKKPAKRKRPSVPCPSCRHPYSEVARTLAATEAVRRVRRCLSCDRTFTTSEQVATAKSATGSRAIATSVTSLLKTLGLTPNDLPSPSTIHVTETTR